MMNAIADALGKPQPTCVNISDATPEHVPMPVFFSIFCSSFLCVFCSLFLLTCTYQQLIFAPTFDQSHCSCIPIPICIPESVLVCALRKRCPFVCAECIS
jgi:hypothetical protein